MLVFVILGQTLAALLMSRGCFGRKSSTVNASVSSIRAALLDGANVVDLRRADERETDAEGVFVKIEGTVSAV